MPVNYSLVEFIVADVAPQIWPFVEGNPIVTRGFDQKNFVLVAFKFENHGNMVKLAIGECSRQKAGGWAALEQEEIPRISISQELFFANIIEFPCLFYHGLNFILTLTLLNVPFNLLVPLLAQVWCLGPEFKNSGWNDYIEPMLTLFFNFAVHMVEIYHALGNLRRFTFKVLQFSIV